MNISTNQKSPLQTPTQNRPFKGGVLNQKGNFIIILGVILIFIAALFVGISTYVFNEINNTPIELVNKKDTSTTDFLGNKLPLEPLPDLATIAKQTANWQIYKDELFNFEVRFPPYFIYEVNNYLKSEYPNYWVTFGERSKLSGDLTLVNKCNIFVYPPNKRSYSKSPEPSISEKDIWKETVTINGLVAERRHGFSSGLYEFEDITFNEKDNSFILSWKKDRPRETCDLIFSTFSLKE